MKPVQFGNVRWASKSDAYEYYRYILNSQPLGSHIAQGTEHMVRDLFNAHPDHAAKMQDRQLSHFEVRLHLYRSRCFFAVAADGTAVDFSMQKCIDAASNHTSEPDQQ